VTPARARAIEFRLDDSRLWIAQVSKRPGLRMFEWSGFVGLRRRLTLRFPAPAARWAASVPTGPLDVGVILACRPRRRVWLVDAPGGPVRKPPDVRRQRCSVWGCFLRENGAWLESRASN
jgi:hypothetical protein